MNKALFILSFILLLSCSRHNDAERLLEKAQAVMETSPDTAAMYLDSILMPEKFLKKDRYMEYLVTRVQAKYKNYDNIKEDTNIFITKTYFDKTRKNSQMNMYSHLYSACVYDERGEYENAMRDYKTAFSLAEKMQDSLYMWRISQNIGGLFYNQLYFDEALKIYKSSITWINNNDDKALCYADIVRIYHLLGMPDSVSYYIGKAIDMAEQANDKMILSSIYQNAHVYCRKNNEPELAKKYLKMAYEINTDASEEIRFQLNFLNMYIEDENIDSARGYVNMLKNVYNDIDNKNLKTTVCKSIARYYDKIDMCDSVMYFMDKVVWFCQGSYIDNIAQNIYEIQEKYDYELQRNIYQTKLNKRLILIVCILIVLLLVSIISLIRITKLNRREQVLTKEVEGLSNVKNDYDKFKHEIKESFDNSLKARFDVIRKVNTFERNNKTNKNVKEIKEYAYGSKYKTAFEASVDVIESSYNNISAFIKETYPELNETEYKVCMLSLAPISVNYISCILGFTTDTVGKARSNVRRKLEIEDRKISIAEHIIEKYYKKQ
ncbi:MAG: hypothetical protein IKY27_02050 [Bacteroidales bacterium]|nr:hypothetical protein [Bacteroidales bacterium]